MFVTTDGVLGTSSILYSPLPFTLFSTVCPSVLLASISKHPLNMIILELVMNHTHTGKQNALICTPVRNSKIVSVCIRDASVGDILGSIEKSILVIGY